jgi:cytochrome P450
MVAFGSDQWELLILRPELVPQAVEEVARFENPVQGFLRVFDRSGHRRRG